VLPDFTEEGFLPAGVHPASFAEFEKRFVYFARSDRRFRVFDSLRELYRQASRSGIVKRFLVGGSFVTSKPEPNDFDCILVVDASIRGRDLKPLEYNLLSRRNARRIFGGDVASVEEGSVDYQRYLVFFQSNRNKEPIGIVEIEI
jgi:hypothetical protein